MTDWKALCEELAEYLALLDEPPHELVCRAQEALAQPEPEADGPAVPEGREPASVVGEPSDEEIMELTEDWPATSGPRHDLSGCPEVPLYSVFADEVVEFARAVLARYGHQPAPPGEGEVGELVAWLRDAAFDLNGSDPAKSMLTRAADLLEQRHPTPVPVSERLPVPGDCLDEGWAWFFSPRVGWRQAVLPVSTAFTHWLPATALPLPQGEVE